MLNYLRSCILGLIPESKIRNGYIFNGQTIVKSEFEQSDMITYMPNIGSKQWYSFYLRKNVHESLIYENEREAMLEQIERMDKQIEELKEQKMLFEKKIVETA